MSEIERWSNLENIKAAIPKITGQNLLDPDDFFPYFQYLKPKHFIHTNKNTKIFLIRKLILIPKYFCFFFYFSGYFCILHSLILHLYMNNNTNKNITLKIFISIFYYKFFISFIHNLFQGIGDLIRPFFYKKIRYFLKIL